MKLKKTNAVLSLLSFVLLLSHMGYSAYSYITLYYNPFLTHLIAYTFAAAVCLHAVLGTALVFMQADGTRASSYPRLNKQTVLQRLSAAVIFPLLIFHLKSYELMSSSAENGCKGLIIIAVIVELLFYAAVVSHSAVSVTKAFITLGALSSEKTLKRLDLTVYVLCGVMYAVTAFSVTWGRAVMFLS